MALNDLAIWSSAEQDALRPPASSEAHRFLIQRQLPRDDDWRDIAIMLDPTTLAEALEWLAQSGGTPGVLHRIVGITHMLYLDGDGQVACTLHEG